MTNHLENHPHAFIDANNKVFQVSAFDESSHNTDLIDTIKKLHGAEKAICCCEFGMAQNGMYWREDKKQFTPVKGYDSWTWDEDSWSWIPPIPQPEIDELTQVAFWNEPAGQWDILTFNNQE